MIFLFQLAEYGVNFEIIFSYISYDVLTNSTSNSFSATFHLVNDPAFIDLVSSLLFGIKESSYVLIISGISFHFGGIFIRLTMDEKTVGYFKEEYRIMDSVQFLLGCICTILGILGFVAA